MSAGRAIFVRFLDVALGSTSELAFQLTIAEQFAYGSPSELESRERLDHVQRMLNRLTGHVLAKLPARTPRRDHSVRVPHSHLALRI